MTGGPIALISETMTGPLKRYRTLVAGGALNQDAAQEAAARRLDDLHRNLRGYNGAKRWLFARPKKAPRGVYLWGGVGRGKSLLMDIFFNNAPVTKKRRVHFHEFMIETHNAIAAWRAADDKTRRRHPAYNRKTPDDPIPYAAHDLADNAKLICFDEFQVTDIADAILLARLFGDLFRHGVVMVATSNRHPDDLYKDGINRQLFLPFIDLLKEQNHIFELDADRDYRLERLSGADIYHAPLGPAADQAMDRAWSRLICGAQERRDGVTVSGRELVLERTARGAARAHFAELCERPLGAKDYLALVHHFDTLFLDHIPKMTAENRNEAKRFVTLIDAVYESRTKFVCSADALPAALYPAGDGAFEFERTASRLIEMQSADYISAERSLPEMGT